MKKILSQNKLLTFLLAGCGGSYLFYKLYLKEKIETIKSAFKEFSDLENFYANDTKPPSLYDIYLKNLLPKLLFTINEKVEETFLITTLKAKIPKSEKKELPQLWNEFKNRAFIGFFASMFLSRCFLFLSQTHLFIIDRLCVTNWFFDERTRNEVFEDIMKDLWIYASNFMDFLLKHIENKMYGILNGIPINHTFTYEMLIKELRSIKDSVEELIFDKDIGEIYILNFDKFAEMIDEKINNLENCEYKINSKSSQKVELSLKFYQIYYDVVTSNLFQVMLMHGLDSDFEIIFQQIKEQMTNIGMMSTNKIVLMLDQYRKSIMKCDYPKWKMENCKDSTYPEELNEFFKMLTQI